MPAPAVAPFPEPAPAAGAADPEARPRASLIPGRWYAAAIDTSPIPVSLALDTIEERLTQDLGIGTLRLYQDSAQLPPEVPARVRTAAANVWATGQYLGPGGDAPMPAQVIELAEWTPPPGTAPITPAPSPKPAPAPAPKAQASTLTLVVVGVSAIAVLGGGIALLMWMRKKQKKKKRKNGKKRR